MATDDDHAPAPGERQPGEPRPTIIRVLAAIAIVGIVGLLLWATVRAGLDLNKKVKHDLTTTSSTARHPRADALENRVVEDELPADSPGSTVPGGGPGKQCAQLVDNVHWFWDRAPHKLCYLLGPSVLDGTAVANAKATYDPLQNGWGVDVTYRGDAFQRKIARPYVGKNVAIVFQDAVVSAPVIEPGIGGETVRISGNFTETDARRIAAAVGAN